MVRDSGGNYRKPKVRLMLQDYVVLKNLLEDMDDLSDREQILLSKINYIIDAIEKHDVRPQTRPSSKETEPSS